MVTQTAWRSEHIRHRAPGAEWQSRVENGSDVSCQIKDLKYVGRPENMSMAGALDYLYCSIKNKNNSQYRFMAFRAYKT